MVKDFRLFDLLEIAPLSRVNLVVGRNNSGKSALLEAIELYASNVSSRTLLGLINAREEAWPGRLAVESRVLHGNPIRHLFRGHSLPPIGGEGIVIGPAEEGGAQIHLIIGAFKIFTDNEGILRRSRLQSEELGHSVDEIEFALMAQEGESLRRVIALEDDPAVFRRARILGNIEPKCPFQVVPTRNMTPQKVATLWDAVGLTDLSKEVISGLSMIDRTIEAIQFVETESPRDRIPLVRTRTSREPLPLRSMGDGTNRLFHLLMALVAAKDGILLIDEFENGLHWSVQANVWKTIFRLALKLNVQVFATTHSRDCVSGFGEAWMENQDLGKFFRLDISPAGHVRTKAYTLQTLTDALESEVEVR